MSNANRIDQFLFKRDTHNNKHFTVALTVLLCAAAALRLYHLDVPSLWFDEAIVPVMASKPFGYLIEWINTKEMHPPLYHILIKGVLEFGTSEFALRVPSVVFGLAGIIMMYKVGSLWVSREAGLFAAVYLTFSPSHVYISREVRPYAFASLFLMAGLILLHRFVDNKDDKTLYLLGILQGLMLATVYTALIPILFFQAFTLVVLVRSRGIIQTIKPLAINVFLLLAPGGYFLAHCMYSRQGHSMSTTLPEAVANYTRAAVGIFLGENIPLANYATYPWHFWAVLGVMIWGTVWLWRNRRASFWLSLSYFGASLIFMLLIRSSFSLTYWHLFSLYPLLALLVGTGVAALIPGSFKPLAAIVLAVIMLPIFFKSEQGAFYQDSNPFFRSAGKAVASQFPPDGGFLVDTSVVDLINWYADSFSLVNGLKEQHIRSNGSPITLRVLENQNIDHQERLMELEPSPGEPVAHRTASFPLPDGVLETWSVDNSGKIPLITPFSMSLSSSPRSFYGHVAAADNVMVRPYWGYSIIPTINNAWTSFEYHFTNDGPIKDLLIALTANYINFGKGNGFVMTCRFDDEEQQILMSYTGPEASTAGGPDAGYIPRTVTLRRVKPFSLMTIGFKLYCAEISPSYPTSNLDTVGFKSLLISARPVNGNVMDAQGLAPEYEFNGLHGVEVDGNRAWRWGVGGRSEISFPLAEAQRVRLSYAFTNFMAGQSYRVLVNGKVLDESVDIPRQSWNDGQKQREIEFDGLGGRNEVVFEFSKINHVNSSMSDTDSTPYTVAFTKLEIEPLGAGTAKP